MQHLEDASASFEVYNSPLSEYACMGFEYGYSAAAPEALVLWEAQYGDFANGAQIVIDQFISSGLVEVARDVAADAAAAARLRGQRSRALQRAARAVPAARRAGEPPVVNCTTAAQYFHLLRRQALDATARPLVVMTPKGLLRLKDAASTLADLAEGAFRPVLDDPRADKEAVRRLVLCGGKIYYDIVGHELRAHADGVAVARIEQLYPFPTEARARARSPRTRSLDEVVWVQEEPQNMGAVALDPPPARGGGRRHRRCASSAGRGARARPRAIRPRTCIEQDRIVRDALTV